MKKYYLKLLVGIVFLGIFLLIVNSLIDSEILNQYYAGILITICINIILAASLNLVLGFTGQLTLGHAGFMAIGAYVAAVLTANFDVPFLIVLLAGGAVSAIIGIIIGFPVLKLKGDYLAITTLAFGQVIINVLQNIDYVGGPRGFSVLPKTTFPWAFIIAVVSVVIIYNIIKSAQGRAMVSIREDEIAAEAMGINTFKYKVMAFAVASFFAGVAGGLFAHFQGFITPTGFGFMKSVEVVTAVVMGGMGSLTGSVIGSSILTCLPEVLRAFKDYRMIFYALALIVLMRFRPQGILGSKELSLRWTGKLFSKFKGKGGKDDATA